MIHWGGAQNGRSGPQRMPREWRKNLLDGFERSGLSGMTFPAPADLRYWAITLL